MTTAIEKRAHLLTLSAEAEGAGYTLLAVSIAYIAEADLDNPLVCAKWAAACEADHDRRPETPEAGHVLRASVILSGGVP